jgi:hypothetical protein
MVMPEGSPSRAGSRIDGDHGTIRKPRSSMVHSRMGSSTTKDVKTREWSGDDSAFSRLTRLFIGAISSMFNSAPPLLYPKARTSAQPCAVPIEPHDGQPR